jgi:hypothetical protein
LLTRTTGSWLLLLLLLLVVLLLAGRLHPKAALVLTRANSSSSRWCHPHPQDQQLPSQGWVVCSSSS